MQGLALSFARDTASNTVSNILASFSQAGIESLAASCFGGGPELRNFKLTMTMIQARIHDAERRGEGENEELVNMWLKSLKRIVYQLEDLLEEIAVHDLHHDLEANSAKRSRSGNSSATTMSNKFASKARDIMKQWENLTSMMMTLNFRPGNPGEGTPVGGSSVSRTETYSSVVEGQVIGRDEEKSYVVKMVLDLCHDSKETVSVIPIVGIGGLGKTALAKLVFDDENVRSKTHFEMRHWVCISVRSSLKEMVCKILQSVKGDVDCHKLSLEQLQIDLREAVGGKRFLLVLDDVCCEDKGEWDELMSLLRCGKQGSKIIVTSRSKVVAQIVATVGPLELKGLPDEKSWELFRSLAFKRGDEERYPYRARIGRDIVKKCANVPLVIKIIACLLHYMDSDREWEHFEHIKLRNMEHNQESILSTLKLSYDRLSSKLKECFRYCSIFPKNQVFVKEDLIKLWMAQGFLRSQHGDGELEYVGHNCFMQLLRRCFFQDVVKDSYGEIITCKMHDFVHDLAQHVAGGETLSVDESKQEINNDVDNIWHVSVLNGSLVEAPSRLLDIKLMRSLLLLSCPVKVDVNDIFSSLTCLRALDLGKWNGVNLPNSLQELNNLRYLKHLRYLKLAGPFKSLPECITRLQYLQSLDVRECHQLKELPKRFSMLSKLRHLCYKGRDWDELPLNFGQLSSLRTLDKFIVGKNNRLDALASLKNLVGHLIIYIAKHHGNSTEGILRDKKLTSLKIQWSSSCEGSETDAKSELRSLEPHLYLKSLAIENWGGVSFPSWCRMDAFPSLLPCLNFVEIKNCRKCRDLPPFNQLPRLESLYLKGLDALEYMEDGQYNDQTSSTMPTTYFRSLKTLHMGNLRKLKYWSREERRDIYGQHVLRLPPFPCLSKFTIEDCSELMSMPLMPELESLEAKSIHGKLLRHILCAEEESAATSSPLSKLRCMKIRSVQQLESLSINLHSLEDLQIDRCADLTNLSVQPQTALRQLHIANCGRLRDISQALHHLSVLEELEVYECRELVLGDIMCDDDEMSSTSKAGTVSTCWQGLKSLRSLKLSGIPNLDSQSLRGITCMSTLTDLWIENCPQLTAIPQSFRELASLKKLYIRGCSKQLETRCYQQDGEDWSYIEHIPDIHLGCPSSSSYIHYGRS